MRFAATEQNHSWNDRVSFFQSIKSHVCAFKIEDNKSMTFDKGKRSFMKALNLRHKA